MSDERYDLKISVVVSRQNGSTETLSNINEIPVDVAAMGVFMLLCKDTAITECLYFEITTKDIEKAIDTIGVKQLLHETLHCSDSFLVSAKPDRDNFVFVTDTMDVFNRVSVVIDRDVEEINSVFNSTCKICYNAKYLDLHQESEPLEQKQLRTLH